MRLKYLRNSRNRRGKKAIAEIIATLLLILVAVAAAAVVYTYIINFVGNTTQANSGNTSVISIDSFCASASSSCTTSSGLGTSYYIVVRNVGSGPISIASSKEPALYFTDVSSGISTTLFCNAPAGGVPARSTYVCFSTSPNALGVSGGDTITVKVVDPDGGATVTTTKALT